MPVDGEPLTPDQAKKLARSILATGRILFLSHASERGVQRDVTLDDAKNVLRGGVCRRAEWHPRHDEWRYLFETPRFGAVVTFDSETLCLVITVWRK